MSSPSITPSLPRDRQSLDGKVNMGFNDRIVTSTSRLDESGQTTAEYALLTGVIALVIAAVAAWATGTGKIGGLLDAVFDHLVDAAG